MWQAITNIAVVPNGTNADLVTTNTGNLLLAKATEAFIHDADGNLISDSLWTNRWDGENRRTAVESRAGILPASNRLKEDWAYLPDGRWIQRIVSTNNGSSWITSSTNRYIWDGQVLLAVLDHTNGVVTSFLRGLDLSGSPQGAGGVGGVLALTQRSNGTPSTAVYAFDGNGNVSALINATDGTEVARYEYDPFGQTIRADGTLAKINPIRFSTQYADDNTGDLKYLYRDYQSEKGRWLSRDPINELGFKVLTRNFETFKWNEEMNVYRVVKNDPTDSYDIYGLWYTGPACKVATVAAPTIAEGIAVVLASIAAAPVTVAVLAVVIVAEGAVITYELCDALCPPKKCPPCTPYPKNTVGYLGPHETKPSAPPEAPRPTHFNLFIVNQQPPPSCHCFWNRLPPHYSSIPGEVDLNAGFPTLYP